MLAHQLRPDPTRHLRQDELAQRWGISPRTLERQRWLGQGPAYLKLGGRVVYRLEDILSYEDSQRHIAKKVTEESLNKVDPVAGGIAE